MIGYIKGQITFKGTEEILLENNGIGYQIRVPLSVMDELPETGEEIRIFTYLYVKEDILALYGFLRQEDLETFKLLITVNGIGPKGALGILSSISPDNLRFAILSEDAATIAKAPGIGKKTAGKLILELKDKFTLSDAFSAAFGESAKEGFSEENLDTSDGGDSKTSTKEKRRILKEASEALVALGYSSTEAHKAVSKVEFLDGMDVEEVLKKSLKYM